MKKGFLKEKAIFQILILIFAIFSVYLIEPASAQQDVCCERTKTGEFCQYTDQSKCDTNYGYAQTTCDQTSYCKLGCCYDSVAGSCFKNTPLSTCKFYKGNFSQDPNCSISECQKSCCVLGSECSYITEKKCKNLFSQFPDLTFDFRQVASESECLNLCTLGEEGCCISEDTCEYTTK